MSVLTQPLLVLLLPSTFLAACCTIGAALSLLSRRTRRLGKMLLGIGVAGLAAVLLLPVDAWLLRPLESRFPAAHPPDRVDGLVVLGGAVSAPLSADRDTPALNRDAERLVAFATLARRYPKARLVFAGGPPSKVPERPSEAEASRALLAQLGVPSDRLLIDDQSRTTWENAVNALALARPRPGETWVLVTSASHMPRAIGAFRAAGWPAMLPWPVAYRTTQHGWAAPLQPVGAKLSAVDLAAHEWTGLLAYRLQGRTDRLLPEALAQPPSR